MSIYLSCSAVVPYPLLISLEYFIVLINLPPILAKYSSYELHFCLILSIFTYLVSPWPNRAFTFCSMDRFLISHPSFSLLRSWECPWVWSSSHCPKHSSGPLMSRNRSDDIRSIPITTLHGNSSAFKSKLISKSFFDHFSSQVPTDSLCFTGAFRLMIRRLVEFVIFGFSFIISTVWILSQQSYFRLIVFLSFLKWSCLFLHFIFFQVLDTVERYFCGFHLPRLLSNLE